MNHGLIRLEDCTELGHDSSKKYNMKSVTSINPFKSVIQISYDIIKAHGGELKV